MFFYAVYAHNMETVYVHEIQYSTDEFHAMCEEAPKALVNGEWLYSPHLIQEWLIEIYGFCPVPYHATFHAF